MKEIKAMKEISSDDYTNRTPLCFTGTVLELKNEGDGNMRPWKALVKLEESGEVVEIISWKFEHLNIIKMLVSLDSVYKFFGFPTIGKNSDKEMRINDISDTGKRSERKKLNILNIDEIKNQIVDIINRYIPLDSIYRVYLNKYIVNNILFFGWPAATHIHHAYEGGLAKHSLGVCKNAISIAENYSDVNMEALVAGALLHDIGKLKEYNKDGSRTPYGNLIGHPSIGNDLIVIEAMKNNINPEIDTKTVILRHIILSHHGELEFGSPIKPNCLEAYIISKADGIDAGLEAGLEALKNIEKNTETQNLIASGTKFFKWN